MSKNLELLTGLFGEQVTELSEDQRDAISHKLDRLVETRVDSKVKFQTEVLEAEAKEKYDSLLTEATSKYDKTLKKVESKTVELAEAHKTKLEKQVKTLSEQLKASKAKEIASFKKDLVEKLDKYLEMELEKKIPDTYVEAVAQVSVLSPIVEGFKKTMEDNYIKFDEENFGLLKDAKEEIMKLREEQATSVKESMNYSSELKNLKRAMKISEVCEGLTDSQRERAKKLLESYDETEITERYEAIRDLIIEGAEYDKGVPAKEKIGVESKAPSAKGPVKVESADEDEDDKDKVEESDDEDSDDAPEAKEGDKELKESTLIEGWAKEFRRQVGLKG
jgi:hypothetical protein